MLVMSENDRLDCLGSFVIMMAGLIRFYIS